MELTFMQETTASGFLFTTFEMFNNRNSLTQTVTVHASSGKLFNRHHHLKLTSYFFKKVSNSNGKSIILNGLAQNSKVKNIIIFCHLSQKAGRLQENLEVQQHLGDLIEKF